MHCAMTRTYTRWKVWTDHIQSENGPTVLSGPWYLSTEFEADRGLSVQSILARICIDCAEFRDTKGLYH